MALHQQRLKTPFTLVYTVRPTGQGTTGDGTVSLRSQTVPEIQRQAVSVVKEVGTHMSVLHGRSAERLSLLLGASGPSTQVTLSHSTPVANP